MRCLVTGAAGFIGSNLARTLVLEGHEVWVTDNLSTGTKDNLPTGVHFYEIPSEKLYERLPRTNATKLKAVLHTGIPSSSPIYRSDRRKVAGAIDGFINVMELAKETGAKVVYTSSSSVYNGLEPPHSEDAKLEPVDFYTEARICMERIARLYKQFYGVKSVGLRLFSVVGGKNELHKGSYANVLTQMLTNDEFTIYGDGSQTRDFIHIDDVVECFIRAMERDVKADVINVGSGVQTSFRMLAEHVRGVKPLKVKFEPVPFKNYVYRTKADTTLMKQELGFVPSKGISDLVELTRRNL